MLSLFFIGLPYTFRMLSHRLMEDLHSVKCRSPKSIESTKYVCLRLSLFRTVTEETQVELEIRATAYASLEPPSVENGKPRNSVSCVYATPARPYEDPRTIRQPRIGSADYEEIS